MMSDCRLCPRECGVDRTKGEKGFCSSDDKIRVARASLHFWEEPCLSDGGGSGTVFFSGCNMKCVFCQNEKIASAKVGKDITARRLCDIFFELEQKGANNINLVTMAHYLPLVVPCIENAKKKGISIPFVYNTSAYEKTDALKRLDGLIDIYLPDFKYILPDSAKKYSCAPDYPKVCKDAIGEMVRQRGRCIYDENGIMKEGTIVRHLLLPGHVYEAKNIIKYLFNTYGNKVVYSLMSQYTPMGDYPDCGELCRRVTKKEYDSLLDYCLELGVENAYIQDRECAKESFIPEFDLRGV